MSCKDICVVMDYDGSNEFAHEEVRRARKSHKCVECAETIAVGDKYAYAVGKNEGDFFSVRTCLPCDEIRRAFCCDGWIFGELWREIHEQLFPSWDAMKAIDCLAKLTTPAAIERMKAEYAEFTAESGVLPPSQEERAMTARPEEGKG